MAIDLAALKRAAEEFFETEVVDMFHYADGKTHTVCSMLILRYTKCTYHLIAWIGIFT